MFDFYNQRVFHGGSLEFGIEVASTSITTIGFSYKFMSKCMKR